MQCCFFFFGSLGCFGDASLVFFGGGSVGGAFALGEALFELLDFFRHFVYDAGLNVGDFKFVEEALVFEFELFAFGLEAFYLAFEVGDTVGHCAAPTVGTELLFAD